MLELATIYAALANGGELKPIYSTRSENRTQAEQSKTKQLLSPEASFLVLDILRDNPPPSNKVQYFDDSYKNDFAWNTGTSWAFRDAWAVGISGPYVLAVWVGNFDGSGNSAFVGRSAAGPLLFSLLGNAFPNQSWRLEDANDTAALNIRKVDVCEASGDLPGKHCPRTTPSWFIPGVSPIKVSTVHRGISIDIKTGLRACLNFTGHTVEKVYEFWPSDFLALFQQAGLSLKTPPAYAPECSLQDKNSGGQKPKISSPLSTIKYVMRSHQKAENNVPFSATVDSDVEFVFWFVDQQYAGKAARGEVFHWPAQVGKHLVTAVDDSGRADSVFIRVEQSY
jgi:penicillin-binding protein 1C